VESDVSVGGCVDKNGARMVLNCGPTTLLRQLVSCQCYIKPHPINAKALKFEEVEAKQAN
jgi:hypothetical protein